MAVAPECASAKRINTEHADKKNDKHQDASDPRQFDMTISQAAGPIEQNLIAYQKPKANKAHRHARHASHVVLRSPHPPASR
jgi:hypothetical protein